MRTMLKACMDVEAANHALRDGSLQRVMETVVRLTKAESVYYGAENGRRTAWVFFDMADPSVIPQLAEPLFQTLRAEVNFIPVMNQQELATGLRSWQQNLKAA